MLMQVLENVEVHPVAWAVVCSVALIAAVTDLRSRRIHNVLTVPVFLAGVVWALATGGLAGVGGGVAGAMILGVPFILLFLFAGGGAGDAKLMLAIGPWVGWLGAVVVLAAVSIAGLIFAISWAIMRGQCREVAGNLGTMGVTAIYAAKGVMRMSDVPRAPKPTATERMPYGLAICAGVWAAAGGVLWLT
jgi:prepilin peptidase CpaA